MKTIRFLSMILAVLMLGVCFVGCDGGNEETTSTDDTVEPEGTAAPEQTTPEQTTDEVTTEPEAPEELLAYDAYYLDTYMKPIWKGKYVYNETVMFVGMDDKASLLYTPDEILSVTSYDLKTTYEKGKDYDVVDGQLVLLEGTRIPVISFDEYYFEKPIPNMPAQLEVKVDGQRYYVYWGEGVTMTQWQVAVTYTHSQTWEGFVPETSDQFTQLIGKLEAGEDVTMIFYGDSITWGASASGLSNTEPYMPTYTQLFTHFLAQKYGYTVKYVNPGLTGTASVPTEDTVFGTNGTITYINPAVGGWTSANGTQEFDTYVKPFVEQYGCDFFLLAFGMNDAGNSPKNEQKAIKKIADQLYEIAPDADMLLVATMIPNPEAINGWYGNQHRFESVFEQLAADYVEDGKSCAVAKMTSMSQRIIENKRFRDHTGNNINHPNDFLARIYAQVVYQTVIGY